MQVSSRMRALSYFYFADFLFALGYALPIYINSTFLENFVSAQWIGVIYAAGSLLAILTLPMVPGILRRFGNYHLSILLITADMLATGGLAFAHSAALVIALFVIDQVLITLTLV